LNATASSFTNTCGGSADDDVWFGFVATSNTHSVSLNNINGSTTDLYHSVYAGTCGSPGTPIVCSDPNSSSLTGLTIGSTYFIRVYTRTATIGQNTSFSVCVTTPPVLGPCGNVANNDYCSNPAVLTTGANTKAGTITGNWTLTSGSKLQASYADLAEYYEADAIYEPGTVLEFGGDKEVTIAEDGTSRVAGVVSTNPAYAMNANCQGIAVALALQGRVPTKVRGIIHKGDMMVSGGNGFARPSSAPHMGTVIGKALENFDGIEGVIEIAVGRL
jgi:hypothetical protein